MAVGAYAKPARLPKVAVPLTEDFVWMCMFYRFNRCCPFLLLRLFRFCSDPDEDEEEYEQKMGFLDVPLAKLVGGGLKDGMTADCADFGQGNLQISVSIRHRDTAEFDELVHPQFFELVGAGEAVAAAARSEAARAEKAAATVSAASASAAAAGKSAAPSAAVGSKRSRVQVDDDGTLQLSDSDEEKAASGPKSGSSAVSGAPAAKRAREEAEENVIIMLDV